MSCAALAWALLAWPAAQAAGPRLVVWMVGDDKVPRVLQPAVEAFQARHPGVVVEVRDVPWADAITKYSAAMASRAGPDLITGGASFGVDLGAKGGLVELTEAAPDLVRLLEQHANPAALQAVRQPGGRMHAAPFDMHVQLQLYRSDLLPRPPATWAEFDRAVQGLRASGRRGFAQQWGNTGWMGFFPYLYQAGGAIYDQACTRAVVDSPQAVQALGYYATLYQQLQSPTDTWPDADGGLENGDYPLIQSGTWLLSSMDIHRQKARGKWSTAPLPAGPTGRRTSFMGSSVLAVTSFSRQIPLAVDFLRTVYQPEVARRMMDTALQLGLMWLPAGRQDQLAAVALPADRKQALLAQFQDAVAAPNCPGWQRNDWLLTRAIQRVVLARGDAKTELSKVAQALTRALRPRTSAAPGATSAGGDVRVANALPAR